VNAKHTIPFLERQSYRRRRLIDTIRTLPVIGGVLWAVPLLWRQSESADVVMTSDAIIYIFSVWLLLVVGGGWLARSLKRSDAEETERER
jgi:hypothetical protein